MSSIKEKFNQISPSEFFYSNRDLAGFSNPTRSLYTAVNGWGTFRLYLGARLFEMSLHCIVIFMNEY